MKTELGREVARIACGMRRGPRAVGRAGLRQAAGVPEPINPCQQTFAGVSWVPDAAGPCGERWLGRPPGWRQKVDKRHRCIRWTGLASQSDFATCRVVLQGDSLAPVPAPQAQDSSE